MEFFARPMVRLGGGVLLVLIILGAWVFSPPADFPSGDIVVITKGSNISDVAKQLADAHIVRFATVLKLELQLTHAKVQAGAYLFKTPAPSYLIASRLGHGDFGLPPVRITFPEGVTVRDIAERVNQAFPDISSADVMTAGKAQEGYLFPDTYLFMPNATSASIVSALGDNFDSKITSLLPEVKASGHSLSDIVTMASLIEKEARTPQNRNLVAGVLWNRIQKGMPLQVDAVFGYIYGRDTYSPSLNDLKVASPYNTYLHAGLPPGPICNPGIESIQAALHPTASKYLYYLTDKNGVMHYAVTFAEHQANQAKYLP